MGIAIQPAFLVKRSSNLELLHRNTWKILTRKAASFGKIIAQMSTGPRNFLFALQVGRKNLSRKMLFSSGGHRFHTLSDGGGHRFRDPSDRGVIDSRPTPYHLLVAPLVIFNDTPLKSWQKSMERGYFFTSRPSYIPLLDWTAVTGP